MARKVSTSARRVTSTTPARRGGARKGSSRYLSVAFCARLLGSTTIKGSRAPLWRRWSRGFNKRACRFIYREVIEPIQKFNKYGAAALGATMSLDMMTAQTPSERDSKMSDWLTLAADIATPGITPNAQNVSAQNVVCHSLPPFSHRNLRVFLRFLPHLLTTPASHHEASSCQSMFLPHAISWAHFPAHLRCTGSLSEAALPVATNTSAHDTSLEQTPSPSENIERDRGCRHPLGRPAQCCDPGCDPRAPQVHPLGAALQTVHLSGAQRAQVDEEERHEGVH